MNSNKTEEIAEKGGQLNAFDNDGTNTNGSDKPNVLRDVSTDKEAKAPTNNTKSSRNRGGAKAKSRTTVKASTQEENKKGFDLSPYVSNPQGNIYAIRNVPEEFIATLFAWVSRSSKSFKTHLQDVIQDFDLQATQASEADKSMADKASKFHEKWTVGYGHSSVAEHAKSAVGIESVSRLASAELELANQFLSITEYSQRYQKPVRGNWYNPFNVGTTESGALDKSFNMLFDKFEKLIECVYTDLKRKYVESEEYQNLMLAKIPLDKENPAHQAKLEGIEKQITRKLAALEKLAFEDARYVLPLAMHTQLGVSANARSWADVIRKMDASYLPESREIAESLRTEISKVLPTLLRHSTASNYQKAYQDVRKIVFGDIAKLKNRAHIGASPYRLPSMSEDAIILEVLSMELMAVTGMVREQAREIIKRNTATDNKLKVGLLLEGMQSFDTPPESFKHVNVEISVEVSEANWHQLLRHNRATEFSYGIATPHLGHKTPPRILEAGDAAVKIFNDALLESSKLYHELLSELGTDAAQYAVLNAHYRPVTMTFSLWEAYHLINLRTSEEAQWDIKETFDAVYDRLLTHYPTLLSKAKRR